MMNITRSSCIVVILMASVALADTVTKDAPAWQVGEPVFSPGSKGDFDAVAVKDPSIVQVNGQWHLFYTARGPKGYSLGYATAKTLDTLDKARHHPLKHLGGTRDPYAAAPQVFYFAPQALWYLVYQTRDSNYQPVYATTNDIADPLSWSAPMPLCRKDEREKWIDFWVICDDTTAYLFYTRSHKAVWMRSTALSDFPAKFGAPQQVFEGVHEAVHLYKVQGKPSYHMIYELRAESGMRSFGLAAAPQLAGPWKRITDTYATGAMLRYSTNVTPWTREISHGEAIRSGYDQRLEYQPDAPWLIQGLLPEDHTGAYADLPWKLGLVHPQHK